MEPTVETGAAGSQMSLTTAQQAPSVFLTTPISSVALVRFLVSIVDDVKDIEPAFGQPVHETPNIGANICKINSQIPLQ